MPKRDFYSSLLIGVICLAYPVLCAAQTRKQAENSSNPWKFSASLSAKEGFDSNVFIQDVSTLASKDSAVTTILPTVGGIFQKTDNFKITLSYAPEFSFYHTASSENSVTHRTSANLGGKFRNANWEFLNSLTWIDGSNQGPIFLPGCDIPAIGGIPLRDRRDGIVYRNNFKWTQTFGSWFVRPQFTTYVHDFRTEQHARVGVYAGYENYVDRHEVNGGFDLGRKLSGKTWVVLGYRFGHQGQGELLGVKSPFSNNYHRFLAGLEGSPAKWLKLSIQGGPDLRDFYRSPNPAFDKDEMIYYVDAAATIIPGPQDTITIANKRFEQPAFSGPTVYEDIIYDFMWRHRAGSKLSFGAGFRIYGGDWQAPINREDWLFTPSGVLTYAFNKKLSGELAYSYDEAVSAVPNTSGREFTRHLASWAFKYTF
jgi:hypothetical protein